MISGNCDIESSFRICRGLQDEKNAKTSVPQLESLIRNLGMIEESFLKVPNLGRPVPKTTEEVQQETKRHPLLVALFPLRPLRIFMNGRTDGSSSGITKVKGSRPFFFIIFRRAIQQILSDVYLVTCKFLLFTEILMRSWQPAA